tara:strand:+ start:22084 stop:26388 length:4305 start_codon:yes stop_codon:yes gene_type:complete
MPALTHNRVKNGFNGGIRKRNASAPVFKLRTMNMGKVDGNRSNALVGGIGSVPTNIRKAYNRRVRCSCTIKEKYDAIFDNSLQSYAEAGQLYTSIVNFSHPVNFQITPTILEKPDWLSFVVSGNTITFSGTPDSSLISNIQNVKIDLIDMEGTSVRKTFTITIYYKVYNVTVSNLIVTPTLNYYILSDYNNQQIDLGDLISYSNASNALYRFNQEHVSNVNHPIRFSNKNGSMNTLSSNITVSGVPGQSNSYVEFLSTNTENYIYCLYHGFGMGVFYQPNLVTTVANGGQISSFTVTNSNNKFVFNGDTFLQPKFNFKGAYLFDVEASNMQSRELVFKDKYGNTYNTFYSYKRSGRTDAHVALVINDNLDITVEDNTGSGYGDNYNSNITILSDNQTGSVTITGVFKLTEILTANITDLDGVPNESQITYQWSRDGVDIAGETNKQYIIVNDDYGKLINVNVTYTDNAGFNEDITSTNTSLVVDTLGTLNITGNSQVHDELTANLTDPEGINSITGYQWFYSDSFDMSSPSDITGAITNKYTITRDVVGKYVSVKVTYTDNKNNTVTDLVSSNNKQISPRTNLGSNLAISGVFNVGNEITATLTDLNDIDINTVVVFTWERISDSGVTTLATNNVTMTSKTNTVENKYTLVGDDENNNIGIYVNYMDYDGNQESLEYTSGLVGVADVTAPTLQAVTQVATPSDDTTPTFVFSSDEAGTITSNKSFSTTTAAVNGNNTITFDAMAIGTYNDVWVKVTDAAGNVSAQLTLDSFEITAPVGVVIAEVTAVQSSINPTPEYTFSSNTAGTISSNYEFTSTTSAIEGNNKIRFSSLKEGTFNDIWVKVTDSQNNESNQLTLTAFDVQQLDLPTKAGLSSTNNGIIYIEGEAKEGEVLTVGVLDNDGGSYSGTDVKWHRVTGEEPNQTSVEITTGLTYTLVNADVGKRIKASITYTDTPGNQESATSWPTAVVSDKQEFTVTANGSSSYLFSVYGTTDNPTLTLERGFTYTITLNVTGHPFKIQTNNSEAASGILYSSGLTHTENSVSVTGDNAQGKESGILSFKVPFDAPDTLYYRCQHHTAMIGTINIVSTQLKIYYVDADLKPVIDKTTQICNSIINRYKKDYNILVRKHPEGDFSSTLTLATASYASQKMKINQDSLDLTTQGTLNDTAELTFTSTFVHELFHIFELVGTQDDTLLDETNFLYVGSEGVTGYKELLNSNKTTLEASPYNMTLDIENLEGAPIENNFGTGTKLYHWEEGLQDESQYTTFEVEANGASSYRFKEYGSTDNPSLTLKRGTTYTFDINATGHPFRINKENTTGSDSNKEYSSGVTGNGTASGTITFVVPNDAPNTLYYNCQHHSSMAGVISIVDTVQEPETRTYNSRRYPILRNEIMTGIKAFNNKYITEMTSGALKDSGHLVNDSSSFITNTGTNMVWR